MKKSIVVRPLPLIINLLISLGGGTLIGLLTSKNNIAENYVAPSFQPPAWVFIAVWTILYTLMAISFTRVMSNDDAKKIYYLQLVLNFLWPILFFKFELLTLSFVWIILLIVAVIIMIITFYKEDKLAGLLQIPYLIWLFVAAALNLGYVLLN